MYVSMLHCDVVGSQWVCFVPCTHVLSFCYTSSWTMAFGTDLVRLQEQTMTEGYATSLLLTLVVMMFRCIHHCNWTITDCSLRYLPWLVKSIPYPSIEKTCLMIILPWIRDTCLTVIFWMPHLLRMGIPSPLPEALGWPSSTCINATIAIDKVQYSVKNNFWTSILNLILMGNMSMKNPILRLYFS